MLQQLLSTAITLVVFFVLLFGYTKLAGPIPFSINSVTTSKSDSFQVSGEGIVGVKPDLATLSVGVQSQGSTVKTAQDSLNQNINKVSESIKALGIESKDIQTQNYTINPQYDFTGGTQKVNGYQASSNLNIKIRNLDKANLVIDAATKAGANNVGGLNFEVADKTKAENEARSKAISEAKIKAEAAAKAAGFSLGRLINYSENLAPPPGPPISIQSRDINQAGVVTQVEPGSNEIRVVVTLSYEVR